MLQIRHRGIFSAWVTIQNLNKILPNFNDGKEKIQLIHQYN